MKKPISKNEQQIWVLYEIAKNNDDLGKKTSDEICVEIGKTIHKSPNTVRKIVENMRRSGRKFIPPTQGPLTKAEAADYLGVSVSTIDRWRKCGKLKSQSATGKLQNGVRKSGTVFFKREWLDAVKHK